MDNVTLLHGTLPFLMNYLKSRLVAVKSLERRLIGWEYRETGTGHMIPNV
jgi:hypothetical protein